MREFARQVIKEHCWGQEMDGLEIQDLAVKLGLLESYIIAEGEQDMFGDNDFEVGDQMFVFTEALQGKKGMKCG